MVYCKGMPCRDNRRNRRLYRRYYSGGKEKPPATPIGPIMANGDAVQ
jgi:hypothetical protein